MKTITASEANRRFSEMLRNVAEGEEYTVVSRGRPVARVTPAVEAGRQQTAARARLVERLKDAVPTGPLEWSRDELYE